MSEMMFTIEASDLEVELLLAAMKSNPITVHARDEGVGLEESLMKQHAGRGDSENSKTTVEVTRKQAKVLEALLVPLEYVSPNEERLIPILDQVRNILYGAKRQG